MRNPTKEEIENGSYEDNKEWWDEIGRKYGDRFKRWGMLCRSKKCPMCKAKIRPIIPHPKKFVSLGKFLNPEWFFHMKATHGIPAEVLLPMITDFLNGKQQNISSRKHNKP